MGEAFKMAAIAASVLFEIVPLHCSNQQRSTSFEYIPLFYFGTASNMHAPKRPKQGVEPYPIA